jgi:hypothetical protein
MKPSYILLFMLLSALGAVLPMPALSQPDLGGPKGGMGQQGSWAQPSLEQRVSDLEQKSTNHHEDAGLAVFFCAAFCALWAQNTKRNPWLWFFLGLLFNIIVIFVLLYKNSKDKKLGRSVAA